MRVPNIALAVVALCCATSLRADLAADVRQARQQYDLQVAEGALAEARATHPSDPIFVEAAALVAELQRMEFETAPESERDYRRDLGERIDASAEEGLTAIRRLDETSNLLRLRADLLATLIRSKFRGKKYLKQLNSAAERALELDPSNAMAWVSLAKPPAFRPGREDVDRQEALDYLGKALDIDPGLETALVLRGRVLSELGRLDEARADWKAALARNPDCRPARELLAETEP